jgi:MoxR-like ATPase
MENTTNNKFLSINGSVNEDIKNKVSNLQRHMNKNIIGQSDLVDKLIISLLIGGHVLVEGPPGIAKTTAIKNLATAVEASFKRIQFTPDLLPSDVVGSDMYIAEKNDFEFKSGPIFNQIVLADEINRAPAKVQSALLEAMAEKQVSIGSTTYPLDELFMVMATQNPLDQQGTYPLPEAQLDRFLFKLEIQYPNAKTESDILDFMIEQKSDLVQEQEKPESILTSKDVLTARSLINKVYLADMVKEYLVQIVMATRNPEKYDKELAQLISFGASPRATFSLCDCAKANAWINGKEYVTPEDIQKFVLDIMRHRIVLSFEAQADNVDANEVLNRILQLVPCA